MTAKISDCKKGSRRKIKQVISVESERAGGRELRGCDAFGGRRFPLQLQTSLLSVAHVQSV